MRYFWLLLFSTGILFSACKIKQGGTGYKSEVQFAEDIDPTTLITFTERFVDLGQVTKGEKRKINVEFTNTSEEVVEIDLVSACSCTSNEHTTTKIKPGGKGNVYLEFDSTSKDHSEVIDVDVILKNTDKKYGYPVVERMQFKFDLVTGE